MSKNSTASIEDRKWRRNIEGVKNELSMDEGDDAIRESFRGVMDDGVDDG